VKEPGELSNCAVNNRLAEKSGVAARDQGAKIAEEANGIECNVNKMQNEVGICRLPCSARCLYI